MDDRHSHDRRMQELADALRPDGDELSRPEFAELALRCQDDPAWKAACLRSMQLDRTIADAMHDLPIPAGSVDRLLARLESAARESSDLPSPTADVPIANASLSASSTSTAVVPLPDALDERRRSTRRHLTAAGVLAAAAAIAGVAWLLGGARVEYGPAEVLNDARLFADQFQPANQAWLAMDDAALPTGFPASAALSVSPVGWRAVEGFLGRRGVAYRLETPAARATLYVARFDGPRSAPRVTSLQTAPSPRAESTTGGWAMSTWTEDDLLYVLVVEGNEREYRSFVRPAGQLATLWPSAIELIGALSHCPRHIASCRYAARGCSAADRIG